MTHGYLIRSTPWSSFSFSVFSIRTGSVIMVLGGGRRWNKAVLNSILELNLGAAMFIFTKFHSGIEPQFLLTKQLFLVFLTSFWHTVTYIRPPPPVLVLPSLFRSLYRPVFFVRESGLEKGSHVNSTLQHLKSPKGGGLTRFFLNRSILECNLFFLFKTHFLTKTTCGYLIGSTATPLFLFPYVSFFPYGSLT